MLQIAYDKLKPRVKKYQRYARPSHLIGKSALLGLISIIAISVLIPVIYNVPTEFYSLVALFLWFVAFYFPTYFLDKKASIYRLNPDERALFHTCSILENLESYFDSNRSELKNVYKKSILQSAEKLLSTIESNWTFGDFKLAKIYFGDNISRFKENIRSRIIPNIEERDESVLRNIEGQMTRLAHLLTNPSLENLNYINETLEKEMNSSLPSKSGALSVCAKFLKTHRILMHSLVMVTLGIMSYSVYFLGINYNLASKDVAFATAFGLVGILIAVYCQYIIKQK